MSALSAALALSCEGRSERSSGNPAPKRRGTGSGSNTLATIFGAISRPITGETVIAKDLTIEGYYTSKPGLTVELGWNANTFLAEFQGCAHPEHQA